MEITTEPTSKQNLAANGYFAMLIEAKMSLRVKKKYVM